MKFAFSYLMPFLGMEEKVPNQDNTFICICIGIFKNEKLVYDHVLFLIIVYEAQFLLCYLYIYLNFCLKIRELIIWLLLLQKDCYYIILMGKF